MNLLKRAEILYKFVNDHDPCVTQSIVQDVAHWVEKTKLKSDAPFIDLWVKRQEFRSLVKYRVGCLSKKDFIDFNKFMSYCGNESWLFVNNLYISCQDIGPGLYLEHAFSTIIFAEKIGKRFHVNQNVTIGARKGGKPSIGDDVSVHTHSVVIGGISIGDGAKIGAGSVIVKSVPPHTTTVPQGVVYIQRQCPI